MEERARARTCKGEQNAMGKVELFFTGWRFDDCYPVVWGQFLWSSIVTYPSGRRARVWWNVNVSRSKDSLLKDIEEALLLGRQKAEKMMQSVERGKTFESPFKHGHKRRHIKDIEWRPFHDKERISETTFRLRRELS
jgi:hypothetical protein